jgi:proteic killer suppression protein
MIKAVKLSKAVQKALKKCPAHVVVKLLGWVDLVENEGLESARRIPGYHDEPLWGQRQGQRSIRLSRGWRAIDVIEEPRGQEKKSFVEVTEVSKHDY